MARRLKITQPAQTRDRIAAARLIATLQAVADGEKEISSQRLKAIEILLRKVLPDLSDIKFDGNVNPVTIKVDLS